ncbi:alpha/beta fold hydrolase [Sphaerotilaceae bacterium SBD11-9]
MLRSALALTLALAALASHAQADNNPFFAPLEAAPASSPYRLHTEAELRAWPTWADIEAGVLEHANLTRGSFSGVGGATLHYRLYTHRAESRGGVVISSGRTEGLAMYQETIYDLVRNGYSVYIHDHRGQGFSQRLLSDDKTIGYVEEFNNYVIDLARFIDGPVRAARAQADTPLFLLAHSMGGAIAALYLEDRPDRRIAAAALITPMMEPWVATGPDPGTATKLVDAYCSEHAEQQRGPIGRFLAERYADGSPFDEQYAALQKIAANTSNDLTHSALRFARHWQARDQARCTGADCGSPHAKVGGVSFRWLNQSCMATERARGPAAARIIQPVLLLQGQNDTVVKPGAQKEFCKNLNAGNGAGYCIGRTVLQARHALLIEDDAYRLPTMNRVLGFFDCVRAGKARCE